MTTFERKNHPTDYNKIIVKVKCPFCGKNQTLVVNRIQLDEYQYRGVLAQHAFPEMSITERDILIIGLCPECQKEI